MRGYGCGVIAALDLLVYLCRYHDCRIEALNELVENDPIPLEVYNRFAQDLSRRYLPLIPYHGINGFMLAFGVNRIFRRYRMPYYASWGVMPVHFWQSIETMLVSDLPVILSIGPNFPRLWQHNKLSLYQTNHESFLPSAETVAHYVTVTALDDDWLNVSSWGRRYSISRREYEDYIRTHSSALVSNILFIRRAVH